MRRASKRLIHAIIALVASVILCIGACLAWFAMNNEVSGNGLQTQVKSGDIVDFKVTAYYLDYSSGNKNYSVVAGNSELIKDANGTPLAIDHNGDMIINSSDSSKDVMRPYSLMGEYTTAVLFKVEYEIEDGSSKKFRIFAECDEDSLLNVERDGETTNFTSGLSNTITFVSATKSTKPSGNSTFAAGDDTPNYTYTQTVNANPTAFVGGVGLREKSFHLNLKGGIADTEAEGNYKGTDYFIMDYEKERFAYISSLLLKNGGGLNSSLTLTGDIALGIEEYDPTKTEYTVTFNANRVTPTNFPSAQRVVSGSTLSEPETPTATGYTFGGWYTDAECTKEFDFNTPITADTTLYAKWTANTVAVIGVALDYTTATLQVGGTQTLNVTFNPTNATNQNVIWSTSNDTVATVDQNGKVTAVATGSATITVTTEDGSKTATCEVTVEAASGGGTTKIYSGNTVTDFTDGTTLTVTGSFDSRKDGTYTYNNVTYSKSIRAGGSGRYLTIQLQAGQKVTVLFGGNDNANNTTASMWFANSDGTEISGTKVTTTNTNKQASGLISYTSVNGGTYRIVCDNNKPCIYAVIIESPAT